MEHSLNAEALALVSACVVAWGFVSARLESLEVSAPIAFVVLGLVTTHGPFELVHLNLHSSTILLTAEVTLALVLFADASRVSLRALRHDIALPLRLLGIGLPLTLGAGAAAAIGFFGGSGIWVAVLIGTIVAPTDAALGAAVISDERVPAFVRRVLNVESGLNDGIVAPFVNLFLAGALSAEALHSSGIAQAAVDLIGGVALGAGIGLVGGTLLNVSRRAGWSGSGFVPLAVLALSVFAYAAALASGTNGFVAAFVSGLAFGSVTTHEDDLLAFVEEAGTLLSLLVWFAFGSVMLIPGVRAAGWNDVVFALLALTAVRMVPVALSLAGAGLDRATIAFIGWFGPRGLASVVFGLIATDSLAPADAKVVLSAVTVTVALSVLAHGVSASPLADRYGAARRHAATEPPEVAAQSIRPRRLGKHRFPAG